MEQFPSLFVCQNFSLLCSLLTDQQHHQQEPTDGLYDIFMTQSPSDNRRSLQVDGLSEHAKGLQTGRHANIISPLTCCNAHQTDTLTCMMSFFLAAEIYTCRLLNLCARNLIVHTALNSCPCAIILFTHDYIFTRQFLHKHNLSYCCYRLVYNLLNHGLFLVL